MNRLLSKLGLCRKSELEDMKRNLDHVVIHRDEYMAMAGRYGERYKDCLNEARRLETENIKLNASNALAGVKEPGEFIGKAKLVFETVLRWPELQTAHKMAKELLAELDEK